MEKTNSKNKRNERSPPQGPSGARWGKGHFIRKFFLYLIRRGGVPSGAAALIANVREETDLIFDAGPHEGIQTLLFPFPQTLL